MENTFKVPDIGEKSSKELRPDGLAYTVGQLAAESVHLVHGYKRTEFPKAELASVKSRDDLHLVPESPSQLENMFKVPNVEETSSIELRPVSLASALVASQFKAKSVHPVCGHRRLQLALVTAKLYDDLKLIIHTSVCDLKNTEALSVSRAINPDEHSKHT